MATNRTDSLIGTTGSTDYTSLQAWEDDIGVGLGTSVNMVTDDYDHYGWTQAQEFDEAFTIGGHTCDATHRIYLAADSNGATVAASQHSHTKTDAALMDDSSRALKYNSSYASFVCNNAYYYAFTISDTNVQISRMQFKRTIGQAGGITGGANANFNRILVEENGSGGWSRWPFLISSSATIYSSLFVNNGASAFVGIDTDDKVINCTFVRGSGASLSSTANQLYFGYFRPDVENCAMFSGGAGSQYLTAGGGGSGFTVLDYNATDHSDLTSKSGEGSNNIYSLSQADQFTAVDNTDWRLKSGNDLGSGGVDRTSTVPKDIWGVDFVAGDIGCEHFAASGGAAVTGDLAVQETGEDTLAGVGKVLVQGSLAVQETGEDTWFGGVLVPVSLTPLRMVLTEETYRFRVTEFTPP